MNAHSPVQEAASGLLPDAAIPRLSDSLILAEQADLVARGQMRPGALQPLRDPATSRAELTIDEEGLGFDSLARLGLVLRLNRFFGLSATGVEDYLLVRRHFGDWVELIAEHLRRMGPELVLTFDTSGSSGPVKHVAHRAESLRAEMAAHLAAGLPRDGRLIGLVPPHHIYGCLFLCILPGLTGQEVVELHHLAPTAAFRKARAGDLIVGTPFTWDLARQTGLRFPAGVHGLTSAGPSTRSTFEAPLGLQDMTEVYGATETGGIATRQAFDAPFALLPHLSRAEADALDLQDQLGWLGDTCFHLRGRKDGVVQVAGVNVSPGLVQAALAAVPGVAEVAVRAGAERLRAFIVPAAAGGPSEAALSAALIQLPAPARPALTFGPALPRGPMGKLCDWPDAG